VTDRCAVCHRPLPPQATVTCLRCLSATRRALLTIARLWELTDDEIGTLPSAALASVIGRGMDEPALPGGDLLVMRGPGAPSGAGRADDPPAVEFELWQWASDWAETRGETVTDVTLAATVDWLSTRTGWAAEAHPAFVEFVADLHRIVGWLEAQTATSDAPETGPPCPYCGTALEREWSERVAHRGCRGHPNRCPYPLPRTHHCADTGGLEDDWHCPRCWRMFTQPQYVLAVAAELETRRAATG
jgi:hypothetical protein